jgi:hypothetical protein
VVVLPSSRILGRQEMFIFVGPSIRAVTLGSREIMVVGPGSPGLCQSSAVVASPKRSVKEEGLWEGLDPSP